jgi:hypothetical protein
VIFGRGSLRRKEAQQRQADLAQYRQEIAALRNQLTELDSKWSAELIAHSLKMRERIADQRRRPSSNQIRPARPVSEGFSCLEAAVRKCPHRIRRKARCESQCRR